MSKVPGRPQPRTWTIKYAERILKDDLEVVGHAAFDIARKAIDKKLKVNPEQYGASLHDPLHQFRKLKSSQIRVVYRVNAAKAEVLILMIGNRRDIWDSEQGEILDRHAVELERDTLKKRAETKPKRRNP